MRNLVRVSVVVILMVGSMFTLSGCADKGAIGYSNGDIADLLKVGAKDCFPDKISGKLVRIEDPKIEILDRAKKLNEHNYMPVKIRISGVGFEGDSQEELNRRGKDLPQLYAKLESEVFVAKNLYGKMRICLSPDGNGACLEIK